MKIIDILIRSYYDRERGDGIRKLEMTLSTANGFLTINVCSLLFYPIAILIKWGKVNVFYSDSIYMLVISEMVLGLIVWYFSLRILEREYLNKKGYSRILKICLPKLLGKLIVVIHVILSISLLLYSMSFLPRLPSISE